MQAFTNGDTGDSQLLRQLVVIGGSYWITPKANTASGGSSDPSQSILTDRQAQASFMR